MCRQGSFVAFLLCAFVLITSANASSDPDGRGIKLPLYDGNRDTFQMWWTKFMAYAIFYKFYAAIAGDGPEADLPAKEELGTTETKENEEARKRNSLAMCSFTMAFQTESLLTLIYKAQTSDWPSGLAAAVKSALFKKYCPDDIMAEVELEAMLNQVKMKGKKSEPSTMFEQVNAIRNRFKSTKVKINEARLMATIISRAPTEYKAIISTTQQIEKNNLTMDILEEAMQNHWRALYGVLSSEEKTSGKEISLAVVDKKEKQSDAASSGAEEKDSRPRRKCGHCGKDGHDEPKCWDLHPEEAPEWYNNKKKKNTGDDNNKETEITAVMTTRGEERSRSMEIIFCVVQAFPNALQILQDPNVWLADSGATVDSTRHTIGMTNIRNINAGTESGTEARTSSFKSVEEPILPTQLMSRPEEVSAE